VAPMSSKDRPWFRYYPKDFNEDEKVRSLSAIAELVYRRILDVMWQANAVHLLNDCSKIFNAIGKGLTFEQVENAWNEIQYPGWEALKTTPDGKWVYSQRLLEEKEHIERISKKRSTAAKKGVKQKLVQKQSKCSSKSISKCSANAQHKLIDPDPDILDCLDKSKQSRSAPSGQPSAVSFSNSKSKHFSTKLGSYLDEIVEGCAVIARFPAKGRKQFNPYEAVTWATNHGGHPKAIAEVVTALSATEQWEQVENPWPWFRAVFAQKNAMYNEADAIAAGMAFKQGEAEAVEVFRAVWAEAMKMREAK